MSAHRSQNQQLPKAQASPAGKGVIEGLRADTLMQSNKRILDGDLVSNIAANWDFFVQSCKEGQMAKENLEYMRQFIAEKTGHTLTPTRPSIEDLFVKLECLLDAYNALCRIEHLLFYFRLMKPEKYSQADKLYPVLNELPKVPKPGWVHPIDIISQAENADSINANPLTYIQMRNAFVYNTKGFMLSPNEVLQASQILARDINTVARAEGAVRLDEQQMQRLGQINTRCTEHQTAKIDWHKQQKLLLNKETEESGKNKSITRLELFPFLGNVQPSAMVVSEAYHFVSRLNQFYDRHPGPAFDEARALFQDLQRELHLDLADAIIKTDFSRYLRRQNN